MNYTTLGVINSTPRERTLSDSHNLSSLFITKFRSSQDDLLMGVLAKCAAKPQASSEDHCRQMDMGDISPTGPSSTHRNGKSDRKIKLSFSVDRLLGNDIDSRSGDDDDADDRTVVGPMMINRINCSLDDCNNCCNCSACPGGYECCKYPHGRNLYVSNMSSHSIIRSTAADSVSVVRPMPIRVTNSINTASLATSVSTTFGGIAQLLKYQGPGVGSCVSSLKPLQTPSQQFRQENGMIHTNSSNNPSGQSGKRKRSWSRAVFSNLQRKGLEIQFQQQKYITKPDRRKLAARLNLTDAQVKVWFQNRRMKWRHTRENLKSGQEKAMEDLSKSNDEAMSSSEDEIDVVTE